MIRDAIAKLAEGQSLTRQETYKTIIEIMEGHATEAQIASFITALRMHGETSEIIAGGVQAMREKFTPVRVGSEVVVDTCGTGGDGAHTFNISTGAALVAAGAGVIVAKHGNKSVSSRCGSADVLASLGVNIAIDSARMSDCLQEVGIAFLFAPALHPAMKYAVGPRQEIGIRTIFNILGPLSNPAGAEHGILGVYHRDLVPLMAEAMAGLETKHLFVVHGDDGLDEITTTTATYVGEVENGEVRTYQLWPNELGIPTAAPEDLRGGSPEENAQILRAILAGEKGPKRDIVVLNAGAAILAGGLANTWPDAIAKAAAAIDSGVARDKLEKLVALTNKG